MASIVNSLSAGAQVLYNQGLLPTNLSTSNLANASPSELNQMAQAEVASETIGTMFGLSTSSLFPTDTADLSEEAMTSVLQSSVNAQATGANDAMTAGASNSAATTTSSTPAATDSPSTGSTVNVTG